MKKNLAVKLLAPAALLCMAGGLAVAPENDVSAVTAGAGTFAMQSVSVRMDEPSGLRFTAAMTESYYQANADKNFGMIIIPTQYLDLQGMTGENVEYIDVLDENYNGEYVKIYNTPMQNKLGEELVDANDTNYYLTGAVAEIYYDNYNLDFIGIGFVETVDGSEVSYEYATFDKAEISASVYETAVDSLKVAGYENNATLQNFVTKGLMQANGVSEEDAKSYTYADLGEWLGLTVSTTADHIAVGGETAYTISSTAGKNFDSLGVEVATDNGTLENGKLTGASEGLANISVKFAGVTLDETTVYVGNEALALYSNDYNYNNERNGRSMACTSHNSNPGNAWGLAQSNIASKGVVDMTAESETAVATAYQTAFGKQLTSAYKMSLNMDSKGTTYRLLETRIPLTDAAYVFENYKSVTVRVMFTNFGTSSSSIPNMGMFVTKDGTGDGNLASSRMVTALTTGIWEEYTFPLVLDSAYVDGSTYRLTFGMDIVEAWGTADIYIADIEFSTKLEVTPILSWMNKSGRNQGSAADWHGFNANSVETYVWSDMANVGTARADYKTAYGKELSRAFGLEQTKIKSFDANLAQQTLMWYYDGSASTDKQGHTINALKNIVPTATKMKARVYVQSNYDYTVKALAYTYGTTTSGAQAAYCKTVNVNQWVELEFDLLYAAQNQQLQLLFNMNNYVAVKDTASLTIYISDLWFE